MAVAEEGGQVTTDKRTYVWVESSEVGRTRKGQDFFIRKAYR
jgi:hypothetical protein